MIINHNSSFQKSTNPIFRRLRCNKLQFLEVSQMFQHFPSDGWHKPCTFRFWATWIAGWKPSISGWPTMRLGFTRQLKTFRPSDGRRCCEVDLLMQFSFEFFLGGIMKPDSGVLFKVAGSCCEELYPCVYLVVDPLKAPHLVKHGTVRWCKMVINGLLVGFQEWSCFCGWVRPRSGTPNWKETIHGLTLWIIPTTSHNQDWWQPPHETDHETC